MEFGTFSLFWDKVSGTYCTLSFVCKGLYPEFETELAIKAVELPPGEQELQPTGWQQGITSLVTIRTPLSCVYIWRRPWFK